MSYVDLNRSGVALMEIVSRPDMRARRGRGLSFEAAPILRYVGSCDGNMDQGSMRADVNVSVRKPGGELRHADRNEERQLGPLRDGRGRIAKPSVRSI
jgi:aspartyl-tRNA(Asn)/glutamyl-tRNA(Gln) amidotransferase subunit B